MNAWPHERRGGGGFLAIAVARAERWLLEPPPPRPHAAEPAPDVRPVVAVIGLAPRCGATTIARALAVELAQRDRSGAALASAKARGPAPALATAAARRLARGLPREVATAAGRLCLLDPDDPAIRELAYSRPAPLVLDVEHGRPPQGPVALADSSVLVAGPEVEPSLADVVAASLTRGGVVPPVVLNRAVEPGRWTDRGVLTIGESRLGARLALAGRDPTPGLAGPIAELADQLMGEAGS
jgi:hypothetical protein